MVQRLAKGVGKPKPTPIYPFLFHLYEGQGLLTAEEELDYRTAKEMAGYWITPDPDSQPDQTRMNWLQPQHPLHDPGHRGRPPREGSPRTGLLPDRQPFGPGDRRVRFHRKHIRVSSNQRRNRMKDQSGWTSPSPASHEVSGRLGANTRRWRRRWIRSALS